MRSTKNDPYAAAGSVARRGEKVLWSWFPDAKASRKGEGVAGLAIAAIVMVAIAFKLFEPLWILVPRRLLDGNISVPVIICAVALLEVIVCVALMLRLLLTGTLLRRTLRCYAVTDQRVVLLEWFANRWRIARSWGGTPLEFVVVERTSGRRGNVLIAWAGLGTSAPKMTGIIGVPDPDNIAELIRQSSYAKDASMEGTPCPETNTHDKSESQSGDTAAYENPPLWPGENIQYAVDSTVTTSRLSGTWPLIKIPMQISAFLFPLCYAMTYALSRSATTAGWVGGGVALLPVILFLVIWVFAIPAKTTDARTLVTNLRVMQVMRTKGKCDVCGYPGSEITFAQVIQGINHGVMIFPLLNSDPVPVPARFGLMASIPEVLAFANAMKHQPWGQHIEFVDEKNRPLTIGKET